MHSKPNQLWKEEDKAGGDTYHPKLFGQQSSALLFPSFSLFHWEAKHPSVGKAAVLQTPHWALVLEPEVNDLNKSAQPYLC